MQGPGSLGLQIRPTKVRGIKMKRSVLESQHGKFNCQGAPPAFWVCR